LKYSFVLPFFISGASPNMYSGLVFRLLLAQNTLVTL